MLSPQRFLLLSATAESFQLAVRSMDRSDLCPNLRGVSVQLCLIIHCWASNRSRSKLSPNHCWNKFSSFENTLEKKWKKEKKKKLRFFYLLWSLQSKEAYWPNWLTSPALWPTVTTVYRWCKMSSEIGCVARWKTPPFSFSPPVFLFALSW